MPGLRVEGLLKRYGDVVAVDGVSVDFGKGTLTTLLGPSGCGKTTTLRCIAGLERPDNGTITIGGVTVFGEGVDVPPEKRKIGLVFQSYAIWPHMNVFDNIAFPLKVRHASGTEIGERVRRVMDMVQLSGLGTRAATQLSGGQQQRVALARALVFDPEVLLLDEPLSNLDTRLRDIVRVELREIQRSLGITTVYVTHDQSEALSISDEVAVMKAGKVVALGPPREVYSRPGLGFVASFVGRANIVPGRLASASGRDAVVSTGFGDVACVLGGGEPPEPGDRVLLTVKPESVVVSPDGGEGANAFEGRVEFTSFFGAFSEVLVSVGREGGERQRVRAVRASEGTSFADGQRVSVLFPAQSCLAVADDGTVDRYSLPPGS